MQITAHIPPRPTADWTEELAKSAVGRPVTLPVKKGEVERQVVGKITDAKIEHGFFVLQMTVGDTTPTGTIRLEVRQRLRERDEQLICAAIIPDIKPGHGLI